MNDITYAVSVDVNNPIIPYNVYVASVLDSNVRYLEITLYENGNVVTLSNTATATASLVTDNVLVNDSVNCTISDSIITVPLEDLQRHGNLDVQVTVTEGTKVLAIPFPIQVRVTPNIAENAQVDENSLGSYAEVVHEIAEARGTYTTLHDAIENLKDIPYSVKLAMDTLFSKAAYADDDAASSYATFHAWAISNTVETLTLFDWDYTEGMNGAIKSVTPVEPTMAVDGLLLQGGENLYSTCAIAPNIATLTEPYKTTITYSDLSADADNGEVMFYHYHATEGRVSIGRQRVNSSNTSALKTFVTDESNQQTVLSWNLTDSGTIEIEYDNVAGTVKFTQGANSYTVTVGTVSEGVQRPKIASASKGSHNTSVKIQHIRIERTVQA